MSGSMLRRLLHRFGFRVAVVWCTVTAIAVSAGTYAIITAVLGIGAFQVLGIVRAILISALVSLLLVPLILGLVRDVERGEQEREQLRVRLQKAARMEALGTLAGGIAHDLNNILSGIVVYPELLLLDLPPESPLRRDVQAIGAAGLRAAQVVQDLMAMARRGLPDREVFDLNGVVAEYLESPEHRKVLEARPGARCVGAVAAAPLWVEGSRIALFKVVMNLVTNAVEAISGEGEVRVSTAALPGERAGTETVPGRSATIELRVADTGDGIPAGCLERIYEPFYTRKVLGRSGTGLGLAVVWGVVQDHHGNIAVTSAVGVGTEFVLTFPPASRSPDQQLADAPVAERGRGERILVVDDIEEQRAVACRMLESLGYQASAVASGEEAIELLSSAPSGQPPPHLLLLDLMMDPGLSGLETFRKIRKFAPGQRAIFASGYAPSDLVRSVADMGAAAFLRKPYRVEELATALRAGLGRAQTPVGNRR